MVFWNGCRFLTPVIIKLESRPPASGTAFAFTSSAILYGITGGQNQLNRCYLLLLS